MTDLTEGAPPSGSAIIQTLEKAWTRIRALHPEVPDVTIVTGSGYFDTEPGTITWGHHWAGRWRHDASGHINAELFIAGELLNDGGRRLLQTMLHEAAHALARVRGIRDTCDEGNRYHNKEFLALARELGLEKPAVRDRKRGFSACTITDATVQRYADLIAELDNEALPYLPEPFEFLGLDLPEELPGAGGDLPGELPGAGIDLTDPEDEPDTPHTPQAPTRSGARISTQCSCPQPRRISLTYAQLEEGPLICGNCLARFTVSDEQGSPARRKRTGRTRRTT